MVEYVILHDAAIVHLADTVKNCLEGGGWEVLRQPPSSPDISPQFSDLILRLHGKQFSNRENILTAVWHKVAQVSMLLNDDGVYLLFHH